MSYHDLRNQKKDNLFVVNQLCLLEDPRYDYIGAGEQRWISNEIISELVNNVVAVHEVGSSAALGLVRSMNRSIACYTCVIGT